MSPRVAFRFVCVCLGVSLAASAAVGFIHLPPRTLQDICKESNHIRLLKVEKFNKEKGVIVFEVAESLKGEKSQTTSLRHIIRTDAERVKPILDWAGEGKTALMFSVETRRGGSAHGNGYVFIDGYCYTVDCCMDETRWLMLRAEPEMSCRYFGSVERLREAVEDILAGKEVKVPTKTPDALVNPDTRVQEITEMEVKNRRPLEITSSGDRKPALPETNSGNPWLKAAWIVAAISAIVAIIWFGRRMLHRMIR